MRPSFWDPARFSARRYGRSLHFGKITLHFPNLQGETGSNPTASATIFPRFSSEHTTRTRRAFCIRDGDITERRDGVDRIADDCFNWFAGRHSDDSSRRRLVGEVRFDCVTSNEHRATV